MVLISGAAAGFGTIGIFGEIALAMELPLATLLPIRFVVAALVVAGLALVRGWPFPPSLGDWLATLGLGFLYTAMTLCFFLSLRFLTAGIATIVLYTYPTFVVALSAVLLGEAVTARKLVALCLTTGGVALVAGTGTVDNAPAGVGLALGAALLYAVYTTGSRALSPSLAPRTLMLGVLFGASASMVGYGIVDGGLALPAGAAEAGVVLGIALVATVVPHLLFYEGVARLEASRVGLVSTVEPVVTVALGAALLGEPITLFVLGGGILVLGGVLLVHAEGGRSDRPAGDASSASDE